MDVLSELNGVFRQVFENNELTVTRTTTANDVEDWDSIAHMILIAAVEQKFGMKFAFAELPTLENVGDMVDIIEKKRSK
jgi:acyl carrier protein